MDLESVIYKNPAKVRHVTIVRPSSKSLLSHHTCFLAERIMEDCADLGLPELGSGLWRFKHLPSLRLQKHFR